MIYTRLLIALVFMFTGSRALGQKTQIDSVQRLIAKASDYTRKVELLNQLSSYYFDEDLNLANGTTEQALVLAKSLGDKKSEAWALVYRGTYFFLSGSLSDAEDHLSDAVVLANELKIPLLQLHTNTILGNIFRDKGDFSTAYDFYSKAQEFAESAKDSNYRAWLHINLSRYYIIVQKPNDALREALLAEAIRKEIGNQILLADTWIQLGHCYRALNEFKKAEEFYDKAKGLGEKDAIVWADYLQGSGEIHFVNGDFQQALKNWSEVLTYYRKHQYKYNLTELLLRIGTVFEQQGFYDLANEYFSNALSMAEKSNYQFLVASILHEQSWVYYRITNYELALQSSRKAERIFEQINVLSEIAGCWDLQGLTYRNQKKYDSALYFHEKSLKARMQAGNKVDISAGLFNLGEFYSRLKEFQNAFPHYRKSLAIDLSIEDKYGISLNYNRLGRVFLNQKKYDSAIVYFKKSQALAIPISANEIFRDNYMDLAAYYEAVGNSTEAIAYLRRYNQLTDSIFNKQTAQSVASYRTLYDVERNEQQIALLNKDNELNKAQLQKQRNLVYTLVGGTLILLGFLVFYLRFSRRLKKLNLELAEKNEEVLAQAEELTEANGALTNLNRNIAEQKEEIQAQSEELIESNQMISRINEELEERIENRTAELKQAFKELDTFFYRSSHDFRRPLTTFMGLAEVAKVLVKDPAALELFEKVNENAVNLDKMLHKLQSISDVGGQELIYKEVFLRDIFELELSNYKSDLERKHITATSSVAVQHAFYSYPSLVKIIVENLLENAIVFSLPVEPKILLRAYERDHLVVIEVQDNGMGIEPEYKDRVFDMYFRGSDHSKGNGLGLYIVKKTVQKMHGAIELETEFGKGTTVRVLLPHRLD